MSEARHIEMLLSQCTRTHTQTHTCISTPASSSSFLISIVVPLLLLLLLPPPPPLGGSVAVVNQCCSINAIDTLSGISISLHSSLTQPSVFSLTALYLTLSTSPTNSLAPCTLLFILCFIFMFSQILRFFLNLFYSLYYLCDICQDI